MARSGERENQLSRRERIRKRREFLELQSGPAFKWRGGHMLVLFSASLAEAGPSRLGIVASKKVGGAVVRNRAKRLVREVFRKRKGELGSSLDVVVIALPGLGEDRLEDVDRELGRAFREASRRAGSAGGRLAARTPRIQAGVRRGPSEPGSEPR